jgi:hypothetical protein
MFLRFELYYTTRCNKTCKNRIVEKAGSDKGILDRLQAEQQFQLNRYLPSPELAPSLNITDIHWDLRDQHPYVSEVILMPTSHCVLAEGSRITG